MSSKPSKWLFDIKADDTNGIREFSVAGFILTYVQKYFSGFLRGSDHHESANELVRLTVGL